MKELEQWVTKNIPEKYQSDYIDGFFEVMQKGMMATSFQAKVILKYYPNAHILIKHNPLFDLDSKKYPNAKILGETK